MTKKQELEFLPAVLEIQESPPSPLGRIMLWVFVAFFSIAIAWACIGKIDIVAVAQGKIIPGDRIKVIQPLEIGTVRTIHVEEGQTVAQGDPLIELDATSSGADQQRLRNELMTAQLDAARLRALSTDTLFTPPAQADRTQVALQKHMLRNQIEEQAARLSALDSTIVQRQAEYTTIQDTVAKLEATLPLITQRAQSLKNLTDKKLAAENTWLELEQQRLEQHHDLATQRNRLKEITAAIVSAQQQRRAEHAEHNRATLTELAKTEERITALHQEFIKAQQRTTLQRLTAPVSGVVQQLAIHTVGGVVTPAQQLMVIVPNEHTLEIEAMVHNKDIGFIHPGQAAEIKIETFPFTKYGIIDAEIRHLSNDAIADEKLGLIYAARVLMKKSVINVDGKQVNLTPGMAVTVEIKTGKRRLIEYFLSPLLQYGQESVRER